MRPGYLHGYGEDYTRPGNLGSVSAQEASGFLNARDRGLPPEFETGYIPEHSSFRRSSPNDPRFIRVPGLPFVRPRDPRTFNVLMI